jgi:hypothetical protein
LNWLQFAFSTARHEAHEDCPFRLMMSFAPNSPLSNLWSIKNLLPDDPHTNSIRDLWNAALRNLRLAHKHAARKYNRILPPSISPYVGLHYYRPLALPRKGLSFLP